MDAIGKFSTQLSPLRCFVDNRLLIASSTAVYVCSAEMRQQAEAFHFVLSRAVLEQHSSTALVVLLLTLNTRLDRKSFNHRVGNVKFEPAHRTCNGLWTALVRSSSAAYGTDGLPAGYAFRKEVCVSECSKCVHMHDFGGWSHSYLYHKGRTLLRSRSHGSRPPVRQTSERYLFRRIGWLRNVRHSRLNVVSRCMLGTRSQHLLRNPSLRCSQVG